MRTAIQSLTPLSSLTLNTNSLCDPHLPPLSPHHNTSHRTGLCPVEPKFDQSIHTNEFEPRINSPVLIPESLHNESLVQALFKSEPEEKKVRESTKPHNNLSERSQRSLKRKKRVPAELVTPPKPSKKRGGTNAIWNLLQDKIKSELQALSYQVITHDRGFLCSICDKHYPSRLQCDRHAISEHATTKYICDQCGRVFARVDSLKRHIIERCE